MTDLSARRAELAWCLQGPPLLDDARIPHFPLPAGLSAWLSEAPLDNMPAAPHRLGRRFESRWRWALGALPGWEVLAHNLAIRDEAGTRTLGAPDLLVSDGRDTWHLELAVKFYLCRPDRSGEAWADWVGPSTGDRLDKKLSRLLTHQLPLLSRPEARAALAAQGLPAPTRTAAILRGVLFAHWQQAPHPHARGRWCRFSALPQALPAGQLLERAAWLGATSRSPWREGPALVEAVRDELTRGHAQLRDADGMRWMVTADTWDADPA